MDKAGVASSTFQLILAVLGFYYAIDRMLMLPPGTLTLTKGLGAYRAYWSDKHGLRLWNGQFLAWGGLLPWVVSVPSEIPPVDLSESSVSLGQPYLPAHHPPPDVSEKTPYDNLSPRHDDGRLVCGDQQLRCASKASALAYTKLLTTLASGKKRAKVLRVHRSERTDTDAIRERMNALLRRTRLCRMIATIAFLALFGGGTWLSLHGSPWPWWVIAGSYALLLFALQATYLAAHRALYPERKQQRWLYALSMFLSPAQAIAAPNALAREALAPFVPEAVAKALLPEEQSRDVLASLWRGANETSTQSAYRDTLEQWLLDLGEDPTVLAAPPEREEPCVAYCPRCQVQLTQREGDCPACAGVSLRSF